MITLSIMHTNISYGYYMFYGLYVGCGHRNWQIIRLSANGISFK